MYRKLTTGLAAECIYTCSLEFFTSNEALSALGKLINISLQLKRPWELSGTTKSRLFFALPLDV